MKKLLLLLIIPFLIFGQGWEQTFGGDGTDVGYSVQQTIDGGYIITGSIGNIQYGDIYLLKTDSGGNEEWSNTYGGLENDIGYSVQQTSDGGFIICGTRSVYSSNDNQIYLMKTNENGFYQWGRYFGPGDHRGYSVQQTTDGGYILTGGGEGGSGDVHLIKTDENGDEQWYRTFGESCCTDIGYSVQQTTDGGYIITGMTGSYGNGGFNVYLIKTNENGNIQWAKQFGGDGYDKGYSVQETIDGGYILTGSTYIGDTGGTVDLYLIKTDENGNEQWAKTFGGDGKDVGYSVQQTIDEGYIITGFTNSFKNTKDVYLIKTNENGDEQWYRTFGAIGAGDWLNENETISELSGYFSGVGLSIDQTTDGGYIITGLILNEEEDYNIYLLKTNSEGYIETLSTIEPPTILSKKELLKTTNILGQENTTIKNQPMIEIYDDGSVEKKYIVK
jgi:hypothetical protein